MRVPAPLRSLDPPARALAAGAVAAPADAPPAWPPLALLALLAVLALLGLTVVAAWAWRLARRHADARAEAAWRAQAHAEARACEEVGRDVAQVTHRLANAVAIVRTNVRWLGEEPPSQDEAHRAERAEVVEETLTALERIAVIAAELRRIAGEARAAGGSAPPAASEPEAPGR